MNTTLNNDIGRRIERVAEYLQQDPDNPHLLAEMVELQLAHAYLPEARLWAERAIAIYPNSARHRNLMAAVLLEEGQVDAAHTVFRELVEKGSDDPVIVGNFAHTLYLKREFQAALDLLAAFPNALALIPSVRLLLARCLHQLSRVDDACAILATHLRAYPDDYEAMGLAALLAFDSEDYEAAGRLADATLTHLPQNLPALVAAGMLALARENMAHAAALLQRAIAARSDTARAWLGMALVEMRRMQFDQAGSAFKRVTQLMPDHAGAWIAHGWCYLMQQDLLHAEQAFLKAIAIDRGFSEAHGSWAVALALKGQLDAARRAVTVAQRLDAACASAGYAAALLDGSIHDAASAQSFVAHFMQQRGIQAAVPIH